MTPRSAAADDGALRGFVFALVAGAGQEGRISNQAERLWSDFARLHGARVVRAASAKVDADLVTHLVFMTPPASEAKLRETLAALPLACRLPTRPPPALLHKAWFVESLRARTALDLAPFAVVPRAPLTSVQPEATRPVDAESPAVASKLTPDALPRAQAALARVTDALDAETRATSDRLARSSRLGVEGDVDGCYHDELSRARASVLEHAASLRTSDETRRFVAEGFPGFVGRTHRCAVAVDRRVASASSASASAPHDDDDDDRAEDAQTDAASERSRAKRRRSRTASTSTRTSLMDLPDEVLSWCLRGLPMLDLLSAAATCRRLRAAAAVDRDGARDDDRDVRLLRVVTWNLKNNDPDPARRFANQPGAGEADGGWHWHSRLPVVARVAQREAPDVLCLQEDMRSMSRELMASTEMSEPGAIRYRCYPSPSLAAPAPERELLEASDDAFDCDAPGEVSREIAARARGGRWEQCGVWWREDAFELVDAGQFEWVDGRALRAARRLVESEGMEKLRNASSVDAHMCPMTWTALRLRRRRGRVDDRRAPATRPRLLIACSTHIEAGHDWNEDCPAKRDSARCVRAAVGILQRRFGADVPVVVAGDFNMQKVQLHRRLLTGEGAGMTRSMRLHSAARANASESVSSKKMSPPEGDDGSGAGPSRVGPDADDDAAGRDVAADFRRDLVDVFDALDDDNPDARFEPLDAGVRTGGHRGTTWHSWRGPDWACMISSTIAKHSKHHAQLAFENREELLDDDGEDRAAGIIARRRPRGQKDHGVIGGHCGKIGGVGVVNARRGAVGHQRHIDHVYVARGEGVRDDRRVDVQIRARVVAARVVTDSASEDVRRPGEPKCACGAALAASREDRPPWSPAVIRRCACGPRGVWGSDHFPVEADIRVSWSPGEARPRSRAAERELAHSPERRGRREDWE